MLKRPVWIWSIPAYFFVEGTAGAALVLGGAAQTLGGESMRGLVKRCRWIGVAGIALGAGFLIYDLGRPERFFNMLRVFRPSSPMSIGSWLLAATGPLAGTAALLSGSSGSLKAMGDAAGCAASIVAMPLTAYTAVLLSNTAVPLWQRMRRTLPPAFIGSAMTSTAALLQSMDLRAEERRAVRQFGSIGAALEIFSTGRFKLLGLAGLAALIPAKSRKQRMVAGALAMAASLCLRLAIFYAGKASAK